ncbi:MAG: PrsW family intramembrane metalloprotease [Actinobacteria bacterium]|nr:PrsW family intramembrane metalloprotease [Actinomycetota bacterium]
MSTAPAQRWAPVPPPRRSTQVLEVIGIGIGATGVLAMVAVIAGTAGVASTTLAGVLAFLPLLVVLLGIRWVDRWEPEPRATLLAAFLWGAGVATGISLVFNTAFTLGAELSGLSAFGQLVLSTAVVAPVVEEVTKGLGVLGILLWRHHSFDGPVDGIVYGATVAAGFAFVENILYFAQYGEALGAVFFSRAVMSPFAHVVFTAMTGIALGIASRERSRTAWVWLFPAGLTGAILLHALWNFSTLSGRYISLYFVLQVPMFIGLVGLIFWLHSREAAVIRHRLGEYAAAGWLDPYEAAMVASLGERRRARAWAASFGRGAQMAEFQRQATNLAYARERLATGRIPSSAGQDQARQLHDLTAARHALYA